MKKHILLIVLLFSTLYGYGQVASRILTSQSNPQPISSPNFLWVDNSPGAMNRLWVADADSLKVKYFQMHWLKDTIVSKTVNLYRSVSWVPSWIQVTGKPTFATVATSGLYNDLSGRPMLATVATSGAYADLSGRPNLFSGSYLDLTNVPLIFPTNTANVSGLQSALDGKQPAGSYLTVEVDPVWTAASPNYRTKAQNDLLYYPISGNPSNFLTSFTEVDPTVPYYVKSITSGQISTWNNPTYAALPDKPTIPTTTSQLTNNSGFITSSGAPVQSVNGLTGAVTLTIPTNNNQLSNGAGYLTGITNAQVLAALGYTPYNSTNPSSYINQAGARSAISLTTTGTGAATYNSSTGVLNVPTPVNAKRIETYSGTTDANGAYTVTFSTAFPVAPNIQASITNQSSTNQFVRVSNVSTTGFTINVYQRNSVTLLAIEVLLAATVNVSGAAVDVLVTSK